jgi:hypothetical protein
MGLLDDAIREHLELKRRRGADPTEVAREETEALGPVRRGEIDLAERAAAAPAAPSVAEEPPEEPVAVSDEPAEVVYRDESADVQPELELEPEPEPEPEPAPEPVPDDRDELELDEHDHTPPHGDPMQATREFSAGEVEQAMGRTRPASHDPDVVPADEHGEEDVLEETPEFLQETPEHDRLWFEQKPPKDFDF